MKRFKCYKFNEFFNKSQGKLNLKKTTKLFQRNIQVKNTHLISKPVKVKMGKIYEKKRYFITGLKKLTVKKLGLARKFLLRSHSKRKRKILSGHIAFFNMWVGFFHTSNLIQLKSSCTNSIYLSIQKNLLYWNMVYKQKKYLLYYWYSFYSFKSTFLNIKKMNSLYLNMGVNKGLSLIVSFSFEAMSFFIYLMVNYFKLIKALIHKSKLNKLKVLFDDKIKINLNFKLKNFKKRYIKPKKKKKLL